MIVRGDVTDYWKARTEDGLWHIDTRDSITVRTTFCGRTERLTNRPGSAGKEQALTCLSCIGQWARASTTEKRD